MKEFDFDELDKAVNSLMGSVKKPEDSTTSEPSSTVIATQAAAVAPDMPVAAPAVEEEPDEKLVVVPETLSPVTVTPSASSPPVAPRSGGRFMDVVHPSSDMKTAAATSSPSREGVTVQPVPVATPSSPVAPVMDMITPAVKRPTPAVTAPTPTPPSEIEPPISNSNPSEPWSSPFLPDTQVEKRPLGGSPSTSETGLSDAIATELSKALPPEEQVIESTIDTDKTSDESLSPDSAPQDNVLITTDEPTPDQTHTEDPQLAPEPPDAPLPAELNSDLVAIESGQKGEATDEIHTPAPPLNGGAADTSTLASAALSTSSIPPQYSEQPSTGDESHQPIYDNEANHQPLAHPPKKKKGMLIIIMIVVVVLLGSGVGAGAYFLGLL